MKNITIYTSTAEAVALYATQSGRTEIDLASQLIEYGIKAIDEGRLIVDIKQAGPGRKARTPLLVKREGVTR